MAWATTAQGIGNQALQIYRATGATAMAETLAPGVPYELMEFRVHLSAAATQETFTARLDGGTTAAVYDYLIDSQAMNTIVDHGWKGDDVPRVFDADDEIDFAWTNTDTRTWGLEVILRIL